MPFPEESRAVIGVLPIARSTLNRQIHPENTLRLPKTALRGTPHVRKHPRRNDLPEIHEPGDHQHRAVEKLSPPGTFEYQSGEPATAWFIWPSRSKPNSI